MMELHDRAQKVTALAESQERDGYVFEAQQLYAEAASIELAAFDTLQSDKQKSRSIVGYSCLTLLYRANEYESALRFARRLLIDADSLLPAYVARIEDIFDALYYEKRDTRGISKFVNRGMEVRLRGGEIGDGTAPADLFVPIVDAWQSIIVRIAEYLGNYLYRQRGPAPVDLRRALRPQIAPLAPASLRFALVLGDDQQSLFQHADGPDIEKVLKRTVEVVEVLSRGDLAALHDLIANPDYRRVIAQLMRLAMPRKRFVESYVSTIGPAGASIKVHLTRQNAKAFDEAIRREISGAPTSEDVQIRGVLRGLQLDSEWIEIKDSEGKLQHVNTAGVAVEDVIGPLVNQEVIITARRHHRAMLTSKLRLIDIEAAESASQDFEEV